MPVEIPAPWLAFIRDVDRTLDKSVEVHCLGGFVLAILWELPRTTGDVDFVEPVPSGASEDLTRVGGRDSEIARRHGIYFHHVTLAELPEGYASRLIELTPRGFKRLRLRAFEVHDLVLAKLGRNSARDRSDVEFLARKGPDRDNGTLRLWVREFFETNRGSIE